MKKHLVFSAAIVIAIGAVFGMTPTYTGWLVNDTVAGNSTYEADLNALQVDQLSYQASCSSASLSTANFNNGTASTGSITVASLNNLTTNKATNTITLGDTATLAATKATNNITVVSTTGLSGVTLKVNGRTLMGGRDWAISTTTGTAVAIKTVLNSIHGIVASTSSNVVYATATAAGLIGNSYTISSSSPTLLTVASPNFTGGAEQALTNAVLTVNGKAYRNGYAWKSVSTSSGTATAIANFLKNISGLTASASGSVVYATATTSGAAGNALTLVSSTPTAMTVGSANFTTGRDSATVTLNGVVLRAGTHWTIAETSSGTAKAVSDAIMATPALSAIITSTWTAEGAVTLTAKSAGINYALSASPASSLVASGANTTGGAVSAIDTTNDAITVDSHGFPTAYGVVFSTLSASTAPGGLANGTTYYVIKTSASAFKLATSVANAQAGTAIDLTSQGSAGGTYRLTPQSISGTAGLKWQGSNDDSNWVDLSVSSVTFATPYTATTNLWDFGQMNYRYVRLSVTAPTTGGIVLRVRGNGKRNP